MACILAFVAVERSAFWVWFLGGICCYVSIVEIQLPEAKKIQLSTFLAYMTGKDKDPLRGQIRPQEKANASTCPRTFEGCRIFALQEEMFPFKLALNSGKTAPRVCLE